MANIRSSERAAPAKHGNDPSPAPPAARPNMAVFHGLLAAGFAIAVALVAIFPDLHANVPLFTLVTLTPLLASLALALRLSGLGRRLLGPAENLVRAALALVIVLDLIVYVGPLFVRGAT